MQSRSDLWKTYAADGTIPLQSVAVIDGVEYSAVSAPIITSGLSSDALSIGNCASATLDLSILTEDTIPQAAEVVIKMRYTDGENPTEWLERGTFYISKRSTDYVTNLVTLQCYDSMLKAEKSFPTSISDGIWPRAMNTVVAEIAAEIGVEIDAGTKILEGDDYCVSWPVNYTMREVLEFIAAVHGGNFIITPQNKLRLVPLISAPEDDDLADADPVNVVGITGSLTLGQTVTVTGISMTGADGSEYTAGSDDGYVITITSNPYATQDICDTLYAQLAGLVWRPYEMSNAIYDPAAELGDYIIYADSVQSVLWEDTVTLNIAPRMSASAPSAGDLDDDEYPYKTTAEKLAEQTAKTIADQTTYYTASSSSTTAPDDDADWSTTCPEKESGVYIWSRTVTTYTNGSTATSDPVCISGLDGVGISSVQNYYLVTSASAGVSAGETATVYYTEEDSTYLTDEEGNYLICDTSAWSTEPQTMTSESRYLWNYSVTTYTDGSTYTTTACIIGMYSEDGISIVSRTMYYAASESNSIVPTIWYTTPQTIDDQNKYLWSYEATTYTDGTVLETAPCVIGVYGNSGTDGEDGQMLYATCDTAEGTAAKIATLSEGTTPTLKAGVTVAVTFTYTNTAASPTLNVNSSGAKPIYVYGAALTASSMYNWVAGATVQFVYDGTHWVMTETSALYAVGQWCYANDKTYVNGAMIAAGTITAAKIYVTELSAICANVGTLTAGIIQSANYSDTAGLQIDLDNGTITSPYFTLKKSGASFTGTVITTGGSYEGRMSEGSFRTYYDGELGGVLTTIGSTDSGKYYSLAVVGTEYQGIALYADPENDNTFTAYYRMNVNDQYESRGYRHQFWGKTYMSSALDVSGAVTIGSTLNITGQVTLSSYLNLANSYGIQLNGAIALRYYGSSIAFGSDSVPIVFYGSGINLNTVPITSVIYANNELFFNGGSGTKEQIYFETSNSFIRTSGSSSSGYSLVLGNGYGSIVSVGYSSSTATRFYYDVTVVGTFTNSSDERLKQNIVAMAEDDRYDTMFDNLVPVTYEMIQTPGKTRSGFTTQGVLAAMKAAGLSRDEFAGVVDIPDDDGEIYGALSYTDLIAPLVMEVQKLKKQVATLMAG